MNQMYQIIPENQAKSKDLLKFLEDTLKSVPKSRRNAFDLIADLCSRYDIVRPSQTFIANKCGNERETSNRALQELQSLGLLTIIPQKRKMPGNTCRYKLAPWITKEMCKALSYILLSFATSYFPLKFLCSRTDLFNKGENVTLVNSSLIVNLLTNPKPNLGSKIKETYYEENREGLGKKVANSKESKKMSEVVSTPGTNLAQEVLNLTPWGKIRCRLFEDDAIFYALGALSKAERIGAVNDRFGYFFSVAVKYTKDHNGVVNNKRFLFLKEAYQMPDDAQMAKPEEESIKVEKISYKNKPKTEPRAYSPERERMGKESSRRLEDLKEKQRISNQVYIDEIKQKVQAGFMDLTTAKNLIESRLVGQI